MNHAWAVTGLFKGFETVGPMGTTRKHLDDRERKTKYHEVWKRDRAGEALPAGAYPDLMYSHKYDLEPEKDFIPAMYCMFPFVNGEIAKVMRRFDLGQGNLHPATFANFDGSEIYDGYEYYFLNIGNLKSALNFEQSYGVVRNEWGQIEFCALLDNEVVLNPEAATGPDIWRDPELTLKGVIFFSGRLGDALRAAGFDNTVLPMLRAEILMD